MISSRHRSTTLARHLKRRHNAGRFTVIFNSHKYVLQLIPSGILRPGKKAVIGPGTVVDPSPRWWPSWKIWRDRTSKFAGGHCSNRAHVIFPYHREMDRARREGARGAAAIGTTSRGIGPAYEDKMARRGIRVCDMMDADRLCEKLKVVVAEKNAISSAAYGHPLESEGLLEQYLELAAHLRGLVTDTAVLLSNALDNGETVLFEGAQGTMLDIDHGTYPFVTSSNATSGGAFTGLGVAPTRLTGVVGVTKAYTTRVGSGPFPAEMIDGDAAEVRERGNEFGATTGRPRRCGWLEICQLLKYAKMLNGIDSLVVTKLDVFDAQKEIQVCTGYRYKGAALCEMPCLTCRNAREDQTRI